MAAFDPSRRALFTGRRTAPAALRPPWARQPFDAGACAGCTACLDACGEGILARDADGGPAVDFTRGECTFCGACAEACPRGRFDRAATPPWRLVPRIAESCLPGRGTACLSCADSCGAGAIRLRPVLGGPSRPQVEPALCTGCGACVAPCPVSAITLTHDSRTAHA